MVENSSFGVGEDFYKKLMETIEAANRKQTLEIKLEIDSLKEAVVQEKIERNKLEKKYLELHEKHAKLEKTLRKNNIIVFGLENTTGKSLQEYAIEKINTLLNLELIINDVNDIFTIGKQQNKKPIIIKFTSYLKKQQILKNAYKLKEINLNLETKIYISEDLSIEERNSNKILRKHLKEAKSKCTNAYIKGGRIYINGEMYTSEELEEKGSDGEIEKITKPAEQDKLNSVPPIVRQFREGEDQNNAEEETNSKKRKINTTNRVTRQRT